MVCTVSTTYVLPTTDVLTMCKVLSRPVKLAPTLMASVAVHPMYHPTANILTVSTKPTVCIEPTPSASLTTDVPTISRHKSPTVKPTLCLTTDSRLVSSEEFQQVVKIPIVAPIGDGRYTTDNTCSNYFQCSSGFRTN